MMKGHIYFFIVKVCIAIENNVSFNDNHYDHLGSSVNIIAFIVITILSIKLLISNAFLNYKEAYHDTNALLNLLKYYLIIVNIFLILTVIIFSKPSLPLQSSEIAFYLVGNSMIGIFGIYCLFYYMKRTLFNGKLNLNQILFLTIQNYSNDNDANKNNLYYYRIYSKMLITHFLNCDIKCAFCKSNYINDDNNQYNIIKQFELQPNQFYTQIELLFKHYKGSTLIDQSNICK